MKILPFFKAPAFCSLVLALASCQPEQAAKPSPPAPKPLTTKAQIDSAMHKIITVQQIPTPGQPISTPAQQAEVVRKARKVFGDSTIVFKDQKMN